FGDWQRRGRVPPQILNDVASYTFRLSLVAKQLMSERQLLFQASLGVRLSAPEANALAILCGQPQVSLPEFRVSLGMGSTEVLSVCARLKTQVLAGRMERPEGPHYTLAEQIRERGPLTEGTKGAPSSLVTDQGLQGSGDLVTDQAGKGGGGPRRPVRPII